MANDGIANKKQAAYVVLNRRLDQKEEPRPESHWPSTWQEFQILKIFFFYLQLEPYQISLPLESKKNTSLNNIKNALNL